MRRKTWPLHVITSAVVTQTSRVHCLVSKPRVHYSVVCHRADTTYYGTSCDLARYTRPLNSTAKLCLVKEVICVFFCISEMTPKQKHQIVQQSASEFREQVSNGSTRPKVAVKGLNFLKYVAVVL